MLPVELSVWLLSLMHASCSFIDERSARLANIIIWTITTRNLVNDILET